MTTEDFDITAVSRAACLVGLNMIFYCGQGRATRLVLEANLVRSIYIACDWNVCVHLIKKAYITCNE